MAAVALAALAVFGAGCSGESAAAKPPAKTAGAAASGRSATPVGVVTHALPGCSAAVQRAPELSSVTGEVAVPLNPFGVVATSDGR